MKSYFDSIKDLANKVPESLADFSKPRDAARMPTQASSNFITNKEQGDWAEALIARAINDNTRNYIAVKYGKSDDLVAGEDGFDDFFKEFQKELDEIGKRPDLLIFRKEDFNAALGTDISHIPHTEIDTYVKKAIAGIEVRSSAFLIDHYESSMQKRTTYFTNAALELKEEIINTYGDLLSSPARSSYLTFLKGMTPETLHITDFKVPGWRSSERLIALNDKLRQLKTAIKEIQKRDYLSITPKVEDLKSVYNWIERYNVPHFYFQVFFDKVYGIPFKDILEIISNPENEGAIFSVESDTKNQNKTTIKIKSKTGTEIAYRVDEPEHRSVRKEMGRGRLLFYVSFNGGTAYLDIDNLKNLLNIKDPF